MDKPIIKDRRAKVTHEQMAEIVKRRANGERLVTLAEEYGITRQRVHMIAKGPKPEKPIQQPRTVLNEEQLAWLDAKLVGSKRASRLATVEKIILQQFGIRMDIHAHTFWLVDRGVIVSDYDESLPLGREFDDYLRSDQARQLREREAVWTEKQKAIPPKKLGRPKRETATPAAPIIDIDDDSHPLDEDSDDDDEEWSGETLSIDEMLASVEETRRKLAAQGRPVSAAIPKPAFRAPGVRTGKHAKATQPAKKKKRKKKR